MNQLALVEHLEHNRFLIQFASEEERRRIVEGGPWRHRGDALLLVAYDGITQVSSVAFDSIPLWIRLYDLPPALRTKGFAEKLGSQVATVIMKDLWYPMYVRIRIQFPLEKALIPELSFKVKGKGVMKIKVRYEVCHTSALPMDISDMLFESAQRSWWEFSSVNSYERRHLGGFERLQYARLGRQWRGV